MKLKYCHCQHCMKGEIVNNPFGIYVRDLKVKDLNFIFDYRTRALCSIGCSRYKKRATCPPNLPGVDYYREVLNSYKRVVIIGRKYPFSDGYFDTHWRTYSTNEIHNALLEKEIELFKKGHVYAKAFIGGSCKMCPQDSCSPEMCRLPHKGRVPLEGTGLDVYSLIASLKEDCQRPPVDYFWRIGAVFY